MSPSKKKVKIPIETVVSIRIPDSYIVIEVETAEQLITKSVGGVIFRTIDKLGCRYYLFLNNGTCVMFNDIKKEVQSYFG